MPTLSRSRRRVDHGAIEAARRDRQRESWERMKLAVAGKHGGSDDA